MSFTGIEGGITAPKGFLAAGVHAGIRKNKNKKDMAMVVSIAPANVAGAFTKNTMAAAPVLWNRDLVARGTAQALVVNSGVANACTGEQGLADVAETATFAADVLSNTTVTASASKTNGHDDYDNPYLDDWLLAIDPEMVAVASTGIIGKPLPMENIKTGIADLAEKLSDTRISAGDAAEAILTTDIFTKETALTFGVDGTTITVGGMAKGSAMIHPNMGTILGFITTDLAISSDLLREATMAAVDNTFNMLSVDGDTSTNDTVLVFANGLAENEEIVEDSETYHTFAKSLQHICRYFVEQIATGDEGRDVPFQVDVCGAERGEDARALAQAVTNSNLVKDAISNEDPNWGRIICAMGASGVAFDQGKINIKIGGENVEGDKEQQQISSTTAHQDDETHTSVTAMENGILAVHEKDDREIRSIFESDKLKIEITLGEPSGVKATAWGSAKKLQ